MVWGKIKILERIFWYLYYFYFFDYDISMIMVIHFHCYHLTCIFMSKTMVKMMWVYGIPKVVLY